MLVDGADPESQRVTRRGDVHLLAIDEDPARVWTLYPGQDPHQRGLAGSVLTEKAMHLAAPDVERDVVVRHDAGERLRDPPELDHRCGARGGRAARARHLGLHMRGSAHPFSAAFTWPIFE